MADQQIVDYIKKAKQAGQSDEQTKSLLLKNGWSETEINSAFITITPDMSSKPYTPPQQPQVQQQPQAQPKPQYKPQEVKVSPQSSMPRERKAGHPLLKFLIFLILLSAVLGGAGYYVATQTDLLNGLFSIFSFSTQIPAGPVVENNIIEEEPLVLSLENVKIATIPEGYDASKVTIVGFSDMGSNAIYCAQTKVGNKISCFVNDEEMESPYNYKPYWVEVSPDGQRVIFLYTDPVKKESFTLENGEEGTRYNGTITMPKYSADSKSFMYIVVGKDGKSFVVLNGQAGTPHDKIYGFPSLSSDNRYILYGARDGQDLLWAADEIE